MKFAARRGVGSVQYAGGSRQLNAKRQKLLTADLRGLSQIMIHRGGAEGAENYFFCLSGDDDKQKHASSKD